MRIGILGLGSIGQRHMQNLLELDEEDLFAYDPRIGEAFFSCAQIEMTNNIDTFWDWKPEAILICTPPDSHYTMISHAAFHKVDKVFVEKPVVHSSHYAKLLALCNESWKMTIAVGYQLRWQLADVFEGRLSFGCSQNMNHWPSQYQKDILLEFSHEIDAAVYINGPVVSVAASEDDKGWHIRLKHIFDKSDIFINPYADTYVRDIYRDERSGRMRAWSFSTSDNDQAYKHELVAFLKVCRGEAWDDRLCTLAQAAHVVKIIDACKRSAKNCEVVHL